MQILLTEHEYQKLTDAAQQSAADAEREERLQRMREEAARRGLTETAFLRASKPAEAAFARGVLAAVQELREVLLTQRPVYGGSGMTTDDDQPENSVWENVMELWEAGLVKETRVGLTFSRPVFFGAAGIFAALTDVQKNLLGKEQS